MPLLYGFPEVTLQSIRHEVIVHGLQEVTSERQVISHVNNFNGPKWQEMNNILLLSNKTIVDFCFGRHEVIKQ